MSPEGMLALAKVVCNSMHRMMGEKFTPANLQGKMFTAAEQGRGALKLTLVRRGPSVTPQDAPAMIAKLSEVSKRVKAFKQGCCRELAMFAYNAVRTAEPSAQILIAPAKSSTDHHAFVVLGVPESFVDETSLSEIAARYSRAVIIDYWAAQDSYNKFKGVYPIGEYEEDTGLALRRYDSARCKTAPFTGTMPG